MNEDCRPHAHLGATSALDLEILLVSIWESEHARSFTIDGLQRIVQTSGLASLQAALAPTRMLRCRSMRNLSLSLKPRLVLPFVLALSLYASAASPKFRVLHAFAGGASDGGYPISKLAIDQFGDLFGTTTGGGSLTECSSIGCGTAFELSSRNGRWQETVLLDFSPSSSGGFPDPAGPVVFDSKGNVYGIENFGGDALGAVYQLARSGNVWTENVLHSFSGTGDGFYPYGGLVRDAAGNIYGSTTNGGANGLGTVFELASNADGTWTYNIIYDFGNAGPYDAEGPYGPLAVDASGSLYGTSQSGGTYGYGTVFKLSASNGVWTDTVLFNFTLDYGSTPNPFGVVMDALGNLYGTTTQGGPYGVGTIYKLTPTAGFWTRTVLHTFAGTDGAYPFGGLAIDKSGTLYGTSDSGGTFGYGNVYKLSSANGKWGQTILHAFSKGTDGANPFAGVTLDQQGNLYGVAANGGAYGQGIVFEITP